MKNLPEINHCKPNPEAYWCPKCKAHNQFRIHSSYDSHHGSWDHCFSCRHCETSMYIPKDAFFALKLILCLSIVCIVGGIAFPYYGLNYALWATGGFCLLLTFFVMRRPMQWSGFNSFQSAYSAQTLMEKALGHPCQPTYYEGDSFDLWAEQFLTSDEVQRLKEKYGEAKKDREIATLESSKKASKLKPFYIALFYAIGLTALIFYFHKLGMFSQLSDHW